jgi:hypothetical protein
MSTNGFDLVAGSRPFGNMYGTINPTPDVVSWAPRAQFAALLGQEAEAPAPAIAAPKPKPAPTPAKHRAADIIDDLIPF